MSATSSLGREFGTPNEIEKDFVTGKEREESRDLHTGLHRLERSTNVIQHGSENLIERLRRGT